MRWRAALVVALTALGLAAALAFGPDGGSATGSATDRVSVASDALQANDISSSAALSDDSRYVAFASYATNLAANDSNREPDVFVRDTRDGRTERVSVAGDGTEANGPSVALGTGPPAISGDGRYVAFASDATNLAPGDTNDATDVFVRDRVAGTTERVSLVSDGAQANNDSVTPAISDDGRYVTFTSLASNLVEGDINGDRDVFVHDRVTGATELVSVSSDGTQGNFASGGLGGGPARISGDGRFVVFGSFADNLVANDANRRDDVFVRDRQRGTTERASLGADGSEGNGHSVYPDISDDGRFVVFASDANNLTPGDTNGSFDVFCRDRREGATVRVSDAPALGGDFPSRFPVVSSDGHVVAFQSDVSNLVAGDTNVAADIFVFDMQTSALARASVARDGSQASGVSRFPAVSANGHAVAFESVAANLVPDDTNGASDVFVRLEPFGAPKTPSATPPRTPPMPTPTTCRVQGDVTGDGSINSLDALFVLQFVAGLLTALPDPGEADLNHDGDITAVDALLILQFDAGIIFCLPP